MATVSFNANSVEPKKSYSPLPAGEYEAVIGKSEWRVPKSGSGQYLAMEIDIISGNYQGRKLFENLNLEHHSEETVRIAREQLSAICRAVGRMQIENTDELHDIPFTVKVSIRPRRDTGEMENRIVDVKARSTGTPAPQAARPTPPSISRLINKPQSNQDDDAIPF